MQGVDGWDVDLPTFFEAHWITNTLAKTLWVFVYILVYGVRPVLVKPKKMGKPPACPSPACLGAHHQISNFYWHAVFPWQIPGGVG